MSSHPVLEIPGWVPTEVAAAARMIVSDTEPPPEVMAVTQRLLSDAQMKRVWTELKRTRREGYRSGVVTLHLSQLPREVESWGAMARTWKTIAGENRSLGERLLERQFDSWSMSAELLEHHNPSTPVPHDMRHGLALALFFSFAVALYCAGERSITKKDVNRWERAFRKRGLNERADAVRSLVAKPEVSRLVIERQRIDPRLRAFIVNLALQVERIFGSPLARTIATTANVAFDKTEPKILTHETVKAILKKLP